MSAFVFAVASFQPGAGVADTTNLPSGGFMAIQGGTSTQMSFVDEVYMGGLAASSAPMLMLLGHDTTVGATLTALSSPNTIGPLHPSAGVLTAPPLGFIAATTLPQRAATITVAKKTFPFNAFGGVVRANYANTSDRFGILGNTQPLGELSLSSFTGSTASTNIGAHIIIETM